jgi:hypothetical protein
LKLIYGKTGHKLARIISIHDSILHGGKGQKPLM